MRKKDNSLGQIDFVKKENLLVDKTPRTHLFPAEVFLLLRDVHGSEAVSSKKKTTCGKEALGHHELTLLVCAFEVT